MRKRIDRITKKTTGRQRKTRRRTGRATNEKTVRQTHNSRESHPILWNTANQEAGEVRSFAVWKQPGKPLTPQLFCKRGNMAGLGAVVAEKTDAQTGSECHIIEAIEKHSQKTRLQSLHHHHYK
eukprot:1580697-Rhodomonas_salina.1